MAMNCTGVLYFPITISLLEGVATELIEARFGLKGVAAFIKLLGKIYKEEGYYLVWNKEQCMLFAHKLGNELSDEEMQEIVELLIAKDIFDRKMYEEHQVLTSVHIQKVWLEATKRRKRDLTPLPYFLMETKVPKNGKEENEKIMSQDVRLIRWIRLLPILKREMSESGLRKVDYSVNLKQKV